jgi:hypothetical protein
MKHGGSVLYVKREAWKGLQPEHTSRNEQPGVVVHACNPSTLNIEAGGLRVQGQAGLYSKTLFPHPHPCQKKKRGGLEGPSRDSCSIS